MIWTVTRDAVKGALGSKLTARDDTQVDEACEAATGDVAALCNRAHFTPWYGTRYFDWPQPGIGHSAELDLLQYSLISLVSATAGGSTLTFADLVLEPANAGPPYTSVRLDPDGSSSFGDGSGGARGRVGLLGWWGHTADASAPAGALAEALDTSETGVDVTDSSMIGVGTLLECEAERMNVTARGLLDSGQNLGTALTDSDTADSVNLSSGAAFHVGEVLTIDSERMLLVDIAGNTGTVKRAWDGSRLAAHLLNADIYVPRSLTVERGAAGTTAVAHDTATALTLWKVEGGVWSLSLAEAVSQVENEQAGYARITGEGEGAHETGGRQVDALRRQTRKRYGRSKGPASV